MYFCKKLIALSLVTLFVFQHVSWSYCLCLEQEKVLQETEDVDRACRCLSSEMLVDVEDDSCEGCGSEVIWDLGYFDFASQGFSAFGSAVHELSPWKPAFDFSAQHRSIALRSLDLSLWNKQFVSPMNEVQAVIAVWLL